MRNIDNLIRAEVLPYIKSFSALPHSIQAKARYVAQTQTPKEFFQNLVSAWRYHNRIALLIDKFLIQVFSGYNDLYSSSGLSIARDLVEKAFLAEDHKRIYSAAVKHALERYQSFAVERYGLHQKELYILLTPWEPSFWALYQVEHLRYLHAIMTYSPRYKELRQRLCNLFHAEEELILDSRIERDFSKFREFTPARITEYISRYEDAADGLKHLNVQGIYLTLEREDLKYIQKIVHYDNIEEQFFGCNLYGTPDLFLRKEIINLLINFNKLDQRESVLMYYKEEILEGLKIMHSQHKKCPSKTNGSKRIPNIFLQTRGTTCGIACVMMVMNYFLGTPLTAQYEGWLRRRLKLRRNDLIPAISLAHHMKQQALEVEVIHQDSYKFWELTRLTDEDVFQQQESRYLKARQSGVVISHIPVDLGDIKKRLDRDWLVIYGIKLDGGIKHALLVYDYNDRGFSVIDPMISRRFLSSEELWKIGDLDTGRWYITAGLHNAL